MPGKSALRALLLAAVATIFAAGASLAQQAASELVVVPQVGGTDSWTAPQVVDISPDERFLVLSGLEGPMQLWDIDKRRLIRSIGTGDPAAAIFDVHFTADGHGLVGIAEFDGRPTVVFWDVETGHMRFEGHSYERARAEATWGASLLALSADRKVIATVAYGALDVWDERTGLPAWSFGPDDGASYVAFALSADGRAAATVSDDGSLDLWDLASGDVRTLAHVAPAMLDMGLSFGPDDRSLLLQFPTERRLAAYDVSTGALQWERTIDIPAFPFDVFTASGPYSAAGGFLVAAGPLPGRPEVDFACLGERSCTGNNFGALMLFDPISGELLRSLPGAFHLPYAIDVSLAGNLVATYDTQYGISVWDLSEQSVGSFGGPPIPVDAAAISADGTRVLLKDDDNRVRTLDVQSGRLVAALATEQLSNTVLPADPAGDIFLTENYDAGVSLWHSAQGLLFAAGAEDLGTFEDGSQGTYLLALAADYERFAVRRPGDEVAIFTLGEAPSLETVLPVESMPKSAGFSPGGTRFAVMGEQGLLEVFDLASGERIQAFVPPLNGSLGARLSALVFEDDGILVVNTWGEAPIRIDVETGETLTVYRGGDMFRAAPTVDPANRRLAAYDDDGVVSIYDLDTGTPLVSMQGHTDSITFVGFAAGGLTVTASDDGTTRIWRTATGEQQLLVMMGGQPEDWLALTPAGFFNFGGNGMELLAVVDGLEAYGVEQFYQALYRPDLVQELLRGDPQLRYADAASRLNLRSILQSGTLPSIRIVSAEQHGDTLRLVADIADTGGGIGNIAVSVRGEGALRAEQRAFEAGRGELLTGSRRIERDIPLEPCTAEPCRNVISIVAYNGENLLASDPVEITVDAVGVTQGRRGTLHVLAIGVDDYRPGGVRPLSYAVADATKVGAALERVGANLYDSVEVTTLLDADVTVANLDRTFTGLGERIEPHDKFVFYIAGHGATLAGRYYFFPQDFTYDDGGSITADAIGQEQWNIWFDRIAARASLFLYDTCEAGTVADGNVQRGDAEVEGALNRLINALGRNVIAASSGEQAANEGYNGHGLFTWTLLEAFASGDVDRNDMIEVTELQTYIENRVPFLSRERFGVAQEPRYDIRANFPLGAMVADIAPVPGIPKEYTHVVVLLAEVRDNLGRVVDTLEPGETVRVIEPGAETSKIAQDGVELGYVDTAALLEIRRN